MHERLTGSWAPLPAPLIQLALTSRTLQRLFSRRNICTLKSAHLNRKQSRQPPSGTGTRGCINSTSHVPANKPQTLKKIEPTPFQMPITTTKLSKINTAQGGQPFGRLPDEHSAHPEVPNLIDSSKSRQHPLATFFSCVAFSIRHKPVTNQLPASLAIDGST